MNNHNESPKQSPEAPVAPTDLAPTKDATGGVMILPAVQKVREAAFNGG